MPSPLALYHALAMIDLKSDRPDQAIETLERGLNTAAETSETPEHGLKTPDEVVDKTDLLWLLARVAGPSRRHRQTATADRATQEHRHPTALVDFLTAHYYVNTKDFRKARQILVPIDSKPVYQPNIKATVKNLLAICHSQLGEPGKQQEFYREALAANPQDPEAKQGLIASHGQTGGHRRGHQGTPFDRHEADARVRVDSGTTVDRTQPPAIKAAARLE